MDDNLCKDVTALLKNSGLRVFATPASIPTGKWEEQIEEALQNASTVWVLLTPNAMSQSVWTHHEFGYFYGFRHGKNIDPKGYACRFLYSDASYLRGLYGYIQGTQVPSFEDPVAIARVIAEGLGKYLNIPTAWVPSRYPTLAPATMNPPRLGRLSPGSQAGPNNSRLVEFTILQPQDRVYNLGLLAFHPEAEITLNKPVPFVGPSLNERFRMQVTWRTQSLDQLPTEATDHAGRSFDVGPGPRQPPGTWPMLITMETDDGRRLAGIVYYRLDHHPGDLPDLNMAPPVFLDWREAKRA